MLDLIINKKAVSESMKIDLTKDAFILKKSILSILLSLNKDSSSIYSLNTVCNRLLPLMRRRPAGRDIIL